MSIERQALIKTVQLFVYSAVSGFLAVFILMSVPVNVALLIFMCILLVYLGYVYYGITVSQLKYRKTLEEMVDQK